MIEIRKNTELMNFVANLSPELEKILKKDIKDDSIDTNETLKTLNSFFTSDLTAGNDLGDGRITRTLSILIFDLLFISISSVGKKKDLTINYRSAYESRNLNKKEIHKLMYSQILRLIEHSKYVNNDLPLFNSNHFSFQSLFNLICTNFEATKIIYECCTSKLLSSTQYSELYSVYLFDRGITSNKRNQEGIVFTPRPIAKFLCNYAINSQTETIIDPAAGSGVLLLEVLKILAKNPDLGVNRLVGIEKDSLLAIICESALKYYSRIHTLTNISIQIYNHDFFECGKILSDIQKSTRKKISVLMNPPYTRQEFLITDYKDKIRNKVLKSESIKSFVINNPNSQFSGQSGLYVYFVLYITQYLSDGDKLGLIIPNSWMDVRYGSAFQKFLLDYFFIDLVVTSKKEKLIPNAEVNTVILVLRHRKINLNRDFDKVPHQVRFLFVHTISELNSLFDQQKIHSYLPIPLKDEQIIKEEDLYHTGKWGMLIRCPSFFRKILRRYNRDMRTLGDYGTIRRGFTSGANDFFYLGVPGNTNLYFKSSIDEKNGDLVLIPKNNEISVEFEKQSFSFTNHPLRIEKEYWMHPIESTNLEKDRKIIYISHDQKIFIPNYIIKSPKELPYFEVKEENLSLIVLIIPPLDSSMLKPGISRYISWAESFQPLSGGKINQRRTCASRKYWYSLPIEKNRNYKLLCMMTINDRFSFFYNPENYFFDARLYGIKIDIDKVKSEKMLEPFLFLYLNSLVVSFQIELLGRANLGEGGLDVKVYEYLSMSIPTIDELDSLEYNSISMYFNQVITQPSLSIFTVKGLAVQKTLDNFLLQLKLVSFEELAKINLLFREMVTNRLEKARSRK